jgi:hypothetical protein
VKDITCVNICVIIISLRNDFTYSIASVMSGNLRKRRRISVIYGSAAIVDIVSICISSSASMLYCWELEKLYNGKTPQLSVQASEEERQS